MPLKYDQIWPGARACNLFLSKSSCTERERGAENGIALAAYESNRGLGIRSSASRHYHFLDPITGGRCSATNIFREVWAADSHCVHHNYIGLVPLNWKPDWSRGVNFVLTFQEVINRTVRVNYIKLQIVLRKFWKCSLTKFRLIFGKEFIIHQLRKITK